MKKMFFVSAFALFGTFAMANEVNKNTEEEFLNGCANLKNDCGIAFLYCWKGELDPDKAKEAAVNACKELSEEQPAPEEGEN
ncbi:hypothetical protein [Faecalibacter sp. LW9]|uniref:hypothetical protein n=1 Tax=Faecalibacter sp. LW9 TaxID=3103144 RepID=UPI002AFE7E03|nr:hypothetical protein [Faecalibacter sp. LW9]